MFSLVRQAELSQDWNYFRQMRSNVLRAVKFLVDLRDKAKSEGGVMGDYGLLLPRIWGWGLGGPALRLRTHMLWVLAGLKAVTEAADRQGVSGYGDTKESSTASSAPRSLRRQSRKCAKRRGFLPANAHEERRTAGPPRIRQDYLPPYQAAVEAGAATIMSAFNSLNGVPSSANPFLLTKILRGEWGFNGFVVSDYTAVMELMNHGIALDPATASRKAITAGVDVDMMSHFYDTQLPGLVHSGQLPMAVVDEAVRRVLRVKFATGLFERPYAQGVEVTAAVAEHRPLVRKAAEESLVLLQNDKLADGAPLLPLSPTRKRVALIGPLADDKVDMIGPWSGAGNASDSITLRQALAERAQQSGITLLYSEGTEIDSSSQAGFSDAIEAARAADVVILALGESSAMSGEAGSRANLDLPGNQQQLLEAVVAAGKPVVLLVFSGRPLVLDWAAKHVPAIMEVWFPGTEAGNAIADVLYGDVSPSGKLPMSFPRALGQEPLYYNQLPTGRPPTGIDLSKPPGDGTRFFSRYTDVPNSALFPFGYGLSYSSFSYRDVKVSKSDIPLARALSEQSLPLLEATAMVTNTGDRTATEVVQCYVRNLGASIEQPVRSLEGFRRVTLAPDESKQISFDLGFKELSFFNLESKPTIEATHYTVWIGGNSLASQQATFDVVSQSGTADSH